MNALLIDPIASWLGPWSEQLCLESIGLRLLLTIVLASVIGWERHDKRHSAGLRTFVLTTLTGATAMLLDQYLVYNRGAGMYIISSAVVLGAAVISVNSIVFSSRNQIRGLTTAVGLWACSVMGLCAGAGYYTATVCVFVCIYICLSLFPVVEIYLKDRSNHFEILLELTNSLYLRDFITTIRKLGLSVDDIENNPAYVNSGLYVYMISFSITSRELKKYKSHDEIIQALSTLDYVYYIEEMER